MLEAVSGCSKRNAYIYLTLLECILLLTLVKSTASIRFYEICEVGECKNGGTMYWPDTFLGMCKCICPYPYVGALCQNTLITPRKARSKRRRYLLSRVQRSILMKILTKPNTHWVSKKCFSILLLTYVFLSFAFLSCFFFTLISTHLLLLFHCTCSILSVFFS